MKNLVMLMGLLALASPAFSADVPDLLTQIAGNHAIIGQAGVIQIVAGTDGNVGYVQTPADAVPAGTPASVGPLSDTTFQTDPSTGAVTQTTNFNPSDSAIHTIVVYTKEANDIEIDSARCSDTTCIPASYKVSLKTQP